MPYTNLFERLQSVTNVVSLGLLAAVPAFALVRLEAGLGREDKVMTSPFTFDAPQTTVLSYQPDAHAATADAENPMLLTRWRDTSGGNSQGGNNQDGNSQGKQKQSPCQ
jgi:hypothetical protein